MHKRIMRDRSVLPNENEFSLDKAVTVYLENDSDVIKIAAKDFCAYLKTAFGIKARISDDENSDIKARLERGNLGLGEGYMGFKLTAQKEGLTLLGYDER